MLISKARKAVVLHPRDPAKITSLIPTAKVIEYKGRQLVGVPHRMDETVVLRRLGFDVPHPIMHYEWPGKFSPRTAQAAQVEFLTNYQRAYCLSSMGVGKTISALWAYDFLRRQKLVNKLLVVAPLSTLERTWADEVFHNMLHLSAVVLYGTRQKRLELLASDADIYIVNHDGLPIIVDALAKRPDINIVIYDELAVCRNQSTRRWKTANTIINKQCPRRVWGLTGAPTPNAPTDAWAQCKLVTPNTVVPYFTRFRDMTMRQLGPYRWVPKEGATDTVFKAMQPSIRFTLEDCFDLPPQIVVERKVTLSDEQKKAFKSMSSSLKAEYANGQITAANEAIKLGKLLQIVCGAAYDNQGQAVELPCDSRLSEVVELVEESEGKTIVFAPFTSAINRIIKYLRGKGMDVGCITGATSKKDRDELLRGFQSGKSPQVLVAQPGTMSHGLTLTAATTIVWYAPIHSYDIFEQANARTRRPSQTRSTVIALLSGSKLEEQIYRRLKNKQSIQGLLLNMVKQQKVTDL